MVSSSAFVFFFFFQAEDGIRDDLVTGVQTCALPIYPGAGYDPLNYAFPPMGNQLYASPVVMEWAHEIKKYVRGEEIVVPMGKYFAMGDNRDHSLDSRYWGFVDRDAIMGRPFLIYWSVEANSVDYGQSSFLQRLKSVVDTLLHLPQRTRWSRMLRTVH